MQTVPFLALSDPERDAVHLTLFGKRGSMIARVTFTLAEARQLRSQLELCIRGIESDRRTS
jgi:hypothetical protein